MTDQSGGGSPVWLGVALIFVGMASKDLFISNQQGEFLQFTFLNHEFDYLTIISITVNYSKSFEITMQCLV